MEIGVPREISPHEHRVGLTPFAVAQLVASGHQVYVQSGAGEDCHLHDEDYLKVGAGVVYSVEEAYQRAQLVCRIGPIPPEEVELLRPGLTVCGFQHLAVSTREYVEGLIEREITLLGYELIENPAGDRPVLRSRSEIAGHLVVGTAARLLSFDGGGRGVILGGIPGIPPATVVILGVGTVGRIAAGLAHSLGAQVIVLDEDLGKLRQLLRELPSQVVTAVASERNLATYTAIADVFIGAVSHPGGRSPFLVTERMVKAMKPGSAILDLSIDHGGCVATSRPTTATDPTFTVHGVTHYCVPDITANVPRTASRAVSLASLPYLLRLARIGVDWALLGDAGLARGVYLYKGWVVNRATAKLLEAPFRALDELLPVQPEPHPGGR